MCGIAGYLTRGDDPEPVGRIMLDMLTSLARRGPDSVGLALYRTEPSYRETCWIRLPATGEAGAHEQRILAGLAAIADVGEVRRVAGLLRIELATDADPAAIRAAVEVDGSDVEVVSLGRQSELVKQVGDPAELESSFAVRGFRGSHAIGHTRLSTESRVDLTHSQPFWARGVLDVATVHNGHITNYDRMRRIAEQRGTRFFSENDSEIIGVYLAEQLERGRSLEEALEASLHDFDGSFTYLVATAEGIGYARDPFALKPLVIVETDEFVAVANEEIAIRAALGPRGMAREPSGNVWGLWRRDETAARAGAA